MSLSTWIFGGLGFVLGGPIGAIIGAVLGSALGHSASIMLEQGTTTSTSSRTKTTSGDISVSLLVLIACVIKADGRVLKSEINYIKPFLVKNFGETGAKQALQLLKKLLEQDIDCVAVCQQMRTHIPYSTCLQIIHVLLELANSDGDFDSREESLIRDMAREMNLQQADIDSLFALYQKSKDVNWAYTALEIEPTATDDEVKRAYRRMAMKYHPDKVSNASEEIRQSASDKFRAIHEAYEHIKTLRDMA